MEDKVGAAKLLGGHYSKSTEHPGMLSQSEGKQGVWTPPFVSRAVTETPPLCSDWYGPEKRECRLFTGRFWSPVYLLDYLGL